MRLRAYLLAVALGSVTLMTLVTLLAVVATRVVNGPPAAVAGVVEEREESPPPPAAPANKPAPDQFATQLAPILKRYCVNCHSGAKPKANLDLTRFADEESLRKNRPVW